MYRLVCCCIIYSVAFYANHSFALDITENEKLYNVTNISVSGEAPDLSHVYSIALEAAKVKAYAALKKRYKFSVNINDVSRDAAIDIFSHRSILFNDGIYSAIFDISFNIVSLRQAIQDQALKLQTSAVENYTLTALILIDGIDSWLNIKDSIDASKVKYTFLSVSKNIIEVIFSDTDQSTIVTALKKQKLRLVKNHDKYFIRFIGR